MIKLSVLHLRPCSCLPNNSRGGYFRLCLSINTCPSSHILSPKWHCGWTHRPDKTSLVMQRIDPTHKLIHTETHRDTHNIRQVDWIRTGLSLTWAVEPSLVSSNNCLLLLSNAFLKQRSQSRWWLYLFVNIDSNQGSIMPAFWNPRHNISVVCVCVCGPAVPTLPVH